MCQSNEKMKTHNIRVTPWGAGDGTGEDSISFHDGNIASGKKKDDLKAPIFTALKFGRFQEHRRRDILGKFKGNTNHDQARQAVPQLTLAKFQRKHVTELAAS
jgi:hypothetical protein